MHTFCKKKTHIENLYQKNIENNVVTKIKIPSLRIMCKISFLVTLPNGFLLTVSAAAIVKTES